jgi:hypothetical protein
MNPIIRATIFLGILIFASQHLFATENNKTKHRINNFLIEYFELDTSDTNSSFSFVSVDLNQDSKKEYLVALYGMNFCGSGGCTMLILNNNFTLNSYITLLQLPIYISVNNFSAGWKDIYIPKRDGKFALMQSNGNSYPLNPSTTKETEKIPFDNCDKYLTYNKSDRIQFKFDSYNPEHNNRDNQPQKDNNYKSESRPKNKTSIHSIWIFLTYTILLLAFILLIKKYHTNHNSPNVNNRISTKTKSKNFWFKISLLTLSLLSILTLSVIISTIMGSSLKGANIPSDFFPTYEHASRAGITALVLPLFSIFISIWIIQRKYHFKFKYYIAFLIFMLIFYPLYFLSIAFTYW